MFRCKNSGLPKENESFITRTDQLDSCNSNKLPHNYNILYLLWGIIKKVLFFPVLKNFKIWAIEAQSPLISIAKYSSLWKFCFGKQYSVQVVKDKDRWRTVKLNFIWTTVKFSSGWKFNGAEKCHWSQHYLHLNGFLWLTANILYTFLWSSFGTSF